MKKFFVLFVLLVAVMLLASSSAFAAIANSKHDLTYATNDVYATNATISSCQFCHTPHLRGYTTPAGAPLWNKSMTGATYVLYGTTVSGVNGVTLGGTVVTGPGSNSLTCLTCHDGTLSVGNVRIGGNQTIPDVANHVASGLLINDAINTTADYNLGTDLSNEHPIGFAVDTTKAGLGSIATMETNSAKFYGATDTMECASCHDPHKTGSGYEQFLRITKNTICIACHVSK